MIIVEIYSVSINKSYDFRLNENTPLHILVEEIVSIICQKEQYDYIDLSGQYMIVRENGKSLSLSLTLRENDVQTGERLTLV